MFAIFLRIVETAVNKPDTNACRCPGTLAGLWQTSLINRFPCWNQNSPRLCAWAAGWLTRGTTYLSQGGTVNGASEDPSENS